MDLIDSVAQIQIMKVEFFINGEEDYTTGDITTLEQFKIEMIYYIESTLQWEYGNNHDFYEWIEDCKLVRHDDIFTTRGGTISISSHVRLETVKTFLKNWNRDFGDTQMVEYEISY